MPFCSQVKVWSRSQPLKRICSASLRVIVFSWSTVYRSVSCARRDQNLLGCQDHTGEGSINLLEKKTVITNDDTNKNNFQIFHNV